MSTYTDLHCRLKENLTILRKPGSKDDGLSPQKVILINPENQFYGSFNGEMNITGGTLSNLEFTGGTITGTTIKDAKFLDGNEVISIGEMASNISQNEKAIQGLEQDLEELSSKQADAEAAAKQQLEEATRELSGLIEDQVGAVEDKVEELSGKVEIVSSDLDKLEEDVEDLSSSSAGCLVFRHRLSLNDKNTDLSSLFVKCCLLGESKLKKGWMYQISLGNIVEDLSINVNNTGTIVVGDGDFIVIDAATEEIAVSDIQLTNIVVIDCQDVDNVKTGIFYDISSYLNSEITSIQQDVETISTKIIPTVSNEIENLALKNDNAISTALSSWVSNDLVNLSNLLSSYSNRLCTELSTTVNSTYLHLSGGTITGSLCVNDQLEIKNGLNVNEGLTAFSEGTEGQKSKFKLESNNVEINSAGSLSLLANEDVVVRSTKNIVLDNQLSDIQIKVGIEKKSLACLSSELVDDTDSKIEKKFNEVSVDAHNYVDELDSKINAAYVHISGDVVTGELMANSIASETSFLGELSVNASQNVVVASKDNIILEADEISLLAETDKIDINGKTLNSILNETVEPYTPTDKLVDFIQSNKSKIKYLSVGDFDFKYDSATNGLNLNIDDKTLSIDVADIFDNKLIKSVEYNEADKALLITFETSNENKKLDVVRIKIDNLFSGGFIDAGNNISIDKDQKAGKLIISVSDSLSEDVKNNKTDIIDLKTWKDSVDISVDTLCSAIERNDNDITNHDLKISSFQTYIDSLSTDTIGTIPILSGNIQELSAQRYEKFEFGGVVGENFDTSAALYDNIGKFINSQGANSNSNIIKNNTWYLVKFKSNIDLSSRIKIKNGETDIVELGDGDQIIIHENGSISAGAPAWLDTKSLEIFIPNSSEYGNVYIIKAGVSRYEYEDEVNRRNKLETELCGILYDFANNSFVNQLNNDSKISNVISVVVKMRDTLLSAFSKISSDLSNTL